MTLPEEVVDFVETLLSDWANAEWMVCGDRCVGQHEWNAVGDEIDRRHAQWEKLKNA